MTEEQAPYRTQSDTSGIEQLYRERIDSLESDRWLREKVDALTQMLSGLA